MEYSDFRKKIVKAGSHKFKVTNSNGTKEAWRWIKKNKWLNIGQPITEREFGLIIKTINQTLQDQLLEGKDIKLPHQMGRIEVRKFNGEVKFKDGKLHTTLPIDWERTLKLWYEDEECYKNRTLVRFEDREIFSIFYNRNMAKYNNKSFYQFIPTRTLKKRLKQKIDSGNFDALLLKKER